MSTAANGTESGKGKGVHVPIPELKKKTITMVGSVALLINNCTGGSMVVLPSVFQEAGWVLPFLALVGIAFLSCMCGIMVIEAMTLVPGNNRFQKRLEYTNIAHLYFPTWLYWIAQIFYQLSILAQNVAMIIQSVQVMDFTLVALTGYSCAIPQFSPSFAFTCHYPGGYTLDGNSPFGNWYLISLGWLITCVMVMPLGFIDLDDNDAVQKGGFFAVIAIVIVWCALAISQPAGLIYVTHFGGKYDDLMGTILFNFAVVYTLPSWANEKRPSVSIVKALAISSCGSVLIFLGLGYFGGAGFPPPANNQTLLNQIYGLGSKISSVTFYLFPACVNLTSIPVNSIMQRYNLKESGVCGAKQAAFWGVVAPWLLAIPLYTGNGYQTLVTWAGLVLISSVNFIFPPILYLLAIRRYGTGPNAIRTLLEEAQLTGNAGQADRQSSLQRNKSKRGSDIAVLEMGETNVADHTDGDHNDTSSPQPAINNNNASGGGGGSSDASGGGVQLITPGTGIGIATASSKRRTRVSDGEGLLESQVLSFKSGDEIIAAEAANTNGSPSADSQKPPLGKVVSLIQENKDVDHPNKVPSDSPTHASINSPSGANQEQKDNSSIQPGPHHRVFKIKVQPDSGRGSIHLMDSPQHPSNKSVDSTTGPSAMQLTDVADGSNSLNMPSTPLHGSAKSLPPLEAATAGKPAEGDAVAAPAAKPLVRIKLGHANSTSVTTLTPAGPTPSATLAEPVPEGTADSSSSTAPKITRMGTSDYAHPPPPPTYDALYGNANEQQRASSPPPATSTSSPQQPVHRTASTVKIDEAASKLAASILSGGTSSPGVLSSEGEGEEEEETEEEAEERMEALRRAEKEEMRRQRTLKKLRKLREKAAALNANPAEVEKEHEEILALDLSPPSVSQPVRFIAWLLSMPWHMAFFISVPHSATSARLPPAKFWPITLVMVIGWGVLISFFVVWTSSVITEATGFHAFPFGIFVVGFFMRTPNLLTEYNSFKHDSGDLNRIFSNSVWQILICLPLPWLLYSIANGGAPFVVHSGAQSILALTLFLLSALILIMFKNYEWYMLRPVGTAAVAIIILFFLMTFLLDYNIIMDLSPVPCDQGRPIAAGDLFR